MTNFLSAGKNRNIVKITPGIDNKSFLIVNSSPYPEKITTAANAINGDDHDDDQENNNLTHLKNLPIDLNLNCYCVSRRCDGPKTYLFTFYVVFFVLVVPFFALMADIAIFIRAESYEKSSRIIFGSQEYSDKINITDSLNYDNCGRANSEDSSFNQTITFTDYLNQTISVNTTFQNSNDTTKKMLFDYSIKQFFRPILLLGGTLSILWVIFFRGVILLANHKNLISTFMTTLFYSLIQLLIFFSVDRG